MGVSGIGIDGPYTIPGFTARYRVPHSVPIIEIIKGNPPASIDEIRIVMGIPHYRAGIVGVVFQGSRRIHRKELRIHEPFGKKFAHILYPAPGPVGFRFVHNPPFGGDVVIAAHTPVEAAHTERKGVKGTAPILRP